MDVLLPFSGNYLIRGLAIVTDSAGIASVDALSVS
jgi:hypothetical protein